MTRKLDAWLFDGLTDLVGELERERTADEGRAAVARERKQETDVAFGKAITDSIGKALTDDNEGEERLDD